MQDESLPAHGPWEIGPFRWERLSARAGIMTVAIASDMPDPEWQFPMIASVYTPGRELLSAWVWRKDDLGSEPSGETPPRIALSAAVVRALSTVQPLSHDAPVTLRFPRSRSYSLLPAFGADLKEGAVVHVAADAVKRKRGEWRLLVFAGICAPVRAVPSHSVSPGKLRCGMLLRTVVGTSEGDRVQLVSVPRRAALETMLTAIGSGNAGSLASARQRRGRWAIARARRFVRRCDSLVEVLLRAVLGAPILVMRVTQAPVGDDVNNVVRIHRSVFSSLGLTAGAQVLVSWCGVQVAAIALEDYERYDEGTLRLLRERQAVGVTRLPPSDDLPPHVICRLSLNVRRQVGVPPDTVVEVRRRVRPLVMSHANQLTIPIVGVVLAALAVPHIKWWQLVILGVITVGLSFTPLRRSRPPRDIWP